MKELSGDESQILFEGDLTDCDFNGIENIDLTGKIFVCDKAAPYFVFPLQDKYIKPILNQVLPFGLVVHKVTHNSNSNSKEWRNTGNDWRQFSQSMH